ncbi:hypothetical protein SAMN05421753_114121 [Planctomicrobium piriforme]|uniref:Uncharacterized protein n=2 Tax=Planctomicrobium piriforme TaxID=1576369 RepID=A0A1I3MVB6_9PLAN|nr:hypothetical protein SAMN05421753_114121 [Planctomicrobium piriforme]
MVCMEVWGGNAATEKWVETLGLKSWVYNHPFHQDSRSGDVYYLSNVEAVFLPPQYSASRVLMHHFWFPLGTSFGR